MLSPTSHARRLACSVSALALSASAALASEITVDAGRGPVTVYVPDDYAAETPTPLIVMLHAFGGTGQGHEAYMKFLDVHEEYGFLYAHPDGTQNGGGQQFWNATDACCDFGSSGVDDSGYLAALLDAIEAQLNVDPRRVYFVGHSNGGFMAHRMACDHADRIAAVASLAGVVWNDPQDCGARSPVHALQIHGTADAVIDYSGGTLNGVVYPGALATAEHWAAQAGCDPVPTAGDPLNLDKSLAGKETTVLEWSADCDPRGSAALWTIHGGAHTPALAKPFARRVVEWLYAHPMPGLDYDRYCTPGEINSTGSAGVLDALGSDALGQEDLTLVGTSLPQGEIGYAITSLDAGFVANPGGSSGNLCVGGMIVRFAAQAGVVDGTGSLSVPLPFASWTVTTGETWHFQLWHRDGSTSNFTDGIRVLLR